ncbi:hypothetical protein [Planococcus versutus]|uniref:Uncharacterized protein n=1 Tax=Planococcus versutus TaxID=1302659 RepID=A0A1B1S5W4_9BACL|nr:hypothetical protein [Planococcus versutus]ANU28580.1 hypothetical protein I858_016495 [Planococcus versutus]
MNVKLEQLDRYLLTRENRLNAGDVLTVKLIDGMLTVYKEKDLESGKKKHVTLVEKFDDQLDMTIKDLLVNQL